MENSSLNTIIFNGLITRLKAAGYSVPVERVLDVQTIFLSFSLSEVKVSELKYLLTPLVARNSAQQTEIYLIIDEYVFEKTGQRVAPEATRRYGIDVISEEREFISSTSYSNILVSVIASIFLFVIAAYLYQAYYTPREILYNYPDTDTVSHTTADTAKKMVIVNASPTIIAPQKDTAEGTGFLIQRIQPIEAKEKNINVQLTVILGLIGGIILSFIVFHKKEKNYLTDATGEIQASGKASGKKSGANSSGEGSNEENGQDISLPMLPHFLQNYDYIISDDRNIIAAKKNLKKYGIGPVPVFDVYKSVLQTAEHGGFYSPAYAHKKEQRKYLVLINENTQPSHLIKLLNVFVQNLISSGIRVEKYTYGNNILNLVDNRGAEVTLSQLAVAKPGYNLIVFSYNSRFISSSDFYRNGYTLNLFSAWPSRSIVTGVPLPDWGSIEQKLVRHQFRLVPAEAGAINYLTKALTGIEEISEEAVANNIGDAYSVNNFTFGDIESIGSYLKNKKLFQLVCALAVYPRLDWAITLAMYKAIIKASRQPGDKPISDYNILLKVVRMPFFNQETMPVSVRRSLLENIDKDTELIARKTIHMVLQEAVLSLPQPGERSKIEDELLLNEFFLYAHDRKQFRQYAASREQVINKWRQSNDRLMKDYIQSGKGRLMPKNNEGKHQTIEEFLVTETEREVRKITFLRMITTLVPAAIIYLCLITFKPGYAYPSNDVAYGKNPVMLHFVKDSCSQNISTLKLSGAAMQGTVIVRLNATQAKDTILTDMDYGVPVNIEYNYKGHVKTVTIDCSYSQYDITIANCHK